jgi:exosortase
MEEKQRAANIYNERFRLAELEQDDFIRIGLASIIIGLVFMIFHFQGNTTDLATFNRSVLLWMTARWSEKSTGGTDFSHGYLIPFVSLAIIHWKRKEIFESARSISYLGLAVLVTGLIFHWLGARVQHPRLSMGGLIFIIWGVPFYIFGWQVAKRLMFPCAYLIFCVPLNFLDSLTFPLRIQACVIGTNMLNGLGLEVLRDGTAIRSMTGSFSFDVADPCSGLRSLLAMTALTAVYAFITQKTVLKKWLLFLAAIPLAIIGNIFRITSIGLVAEAFGEKFASKLYHDYSGYVVFSVAIGLMVVTGSLLSMNWKETLSKWKKKLISPNGPSQPSKPPTPA